MRISLRTNRIRCGNSQSEQVEQQQKSAYRKNGSLSSVSRPENIVRKNSTSLTIDRDIHPNLQRPTVLEKLIDVPKRRQSCHVGADQHLGAGVHMSRAPIIDGDTLVTMSTTWQTTSISAFVNILNSLFWSLFFDWHTILARTCDLLNSTNSSLAS